MSVISIDRDSGISVNIVRMAVTDQLSAVGVPGYILANQASIVAANMGAFSWNASDEVLVTASDGNSYFTISSDFNSLVPSGSGSQLAQVSLTAAQFNGMYAAPVLLVPAPSAGTMNIVDKLILVQHFVSASFAAGGVIAAQYDSTVHGAGVVASATLAAATLNAAAASIVWELGNVTSVVYANAVAKPIYLSNQTAAFTTGDSTFTVKVYYRNVVTP